MIWLLHGKINFETHYNDFYRYLEYSTISAFGWMNFTTSEISIQQPLINIQPPQISRSYISSFIEFIEKCQYTFWSCCMIDSSKNTTVRGN